MSFRPFSLGDALLLQRLRKHSTPLHFERFLLEPVSPLRTVLNAFFAWRRHAFFTYILRQEENGLAREGIIQLYLRPHSNEADVTLLGPALDAPEGHPAIWQKLLTFSAQRMARHNACRLFSDLPDQPLVVNTFRQVGFRLLTRLTIWRISRRRLAQLEPAAALRPQQPEDAPLLERLYHRATPDAVRRMEMGPLPDQPEEDRIPPILLNPNRLPISSYVVDDDRGSGLAGCLQILWGRRGAWIRLWVEANDSDTRCADQMLLFALHRIRQAPSARRAYVGVRAYQTVLNPLLSEYGLAPFTDRVLMARSIFNWRRRSVHHGAPVLKPVSEAVPGPLAIPKAETPGHGPVCPASAQAPGGAPLASRDAPSPPP